MSLPSIVSYGAGAKTSTLVWDSDLTIPDGYAIESASGEVGIVGDVSVSGNISSEGVVTAGNTITSLNGDLVGINAVLSDKQLVIGKIVSDASVTLTQPPDYSSNRGYTSPDYPITDSIAGVCYIVPPITSVVDRDGSIITTFTIQAKLANGTYQNLSSITLDSKGTYTGSTEAAPTPIGTTALRYVTSSRGTATHTISNLSLSLTPIPMY